MQAFQREAARMLRPTMATDNPAGALALLEAGNTRFRAGLSTCGPVTSRTLALENGQSPFAVVLGCSDSRVPIETIFDQEPGSLFVVRIAGNFLNDDVLGSIEFAIAKLHSKLILVLGHTQCGAVTAAVAQIENDTREPGHIANLAAAIAPAAQAARELPGDWLANAIAENVQRNVEAMTAGSPIIADAVARGEARVAGGLYDIGTGRVVFS
jgi:carbonic anhydrase